MHLNGSGSTSDALIFRKSCAGILLLALVLGSFSAPAAAEEKHMDQQLIAVLKPYWQDLTGKRPAPKAGLYWFEYRVTPPLPSHWPPSQSTTLYYYAYAAGNPSQRPVMDGEHNSLPWARVEVERDPQARPKVTLLRRDLKELGIQGFGPVMQEEAEAHQARGAASAVLLGALTGLPPAGSDEEKTLQKFYCQWRKWNGVIAQELLQRHKDFFRWLACGEGN
jgi:hypothetical protein